MPPHRPWRYDPNAGRFRSPAGRFLSSRDVRNAVDRRLDDASKAIAALSDGYRQGQITGAAWMRGMRDAIRETHLMSALAAKGGRAGLTSQDYGRLGARIKHEYQWLRDFGAQINSGAQRTDGTMLNRAKLYGQAGRGTFDQFDADEKRRLGYDEERNVLDQDAAHCTGFNSCPEQTALGWVPIGTLTEIGTRKCGRNDRCRKERRNSQTGVVAA